jgi:uncharacterized protein YaiE (UPF0345 family)
MSRYSGNNGGSNGGNNSDYDDTTVKLQKYAALSLVPTRVSAIGHEQFGTSFIAGFEEMEVIDGIVFQRDDKPDTWKVFSAGKFFNLNPEDGLVYENFSKDGGYSGQMSAQDILDHPRVAGFSETFGGTDYFYTPVGVVIEEADDVATNDDLEIETTTNPSISVGDSSMLLSNKTWVRTLAKKLTSEGDSIINDNGEYGEGADNPKFDDHEWLTTEDPTLRDQLEGRTLELWVTEESMEVDGSDEERTYTVPNLMDVKTGNFVTIDNGIESSGGDAIGNASAETDKAAATDGGTAATSTSDSSDTESTQSTDSPSAPTDTGSAGLPEDVPDKLEDLIDYAARNMDSPSGDDIRGFAEDEVENPDDIDWEAAATEANQRAE